jgi:hypothetical protein
MKWKHYNSSLRNDHVLWADAAYQWLSSYRNRLWTSYYMNIMFHHLPGSYGSRIARMHLAMTKFYGQFCTRFVRNPRAPSKQECLPRLWLAPDLPAPKHEKSPLHEVTINDGLHFNGFLLIPPESRLRRDVIAHVDRHQPRYCQHGIARIHIASMDQRIGKTADYAFKTVSGGRVDHEHILILPRSVSELPDRGVPAPPDDLKNIQSAFNLSEDAARLLQVGGQP